MRRVRVAEQVVALTLATFVAAAVGVAPALAEPTTPPADETDAEIDVPEPVAGEEVCTIADHRMPELSGLVAFDEGYVTINDGGQSWEAQPIFFLDQHCQVVEEIRYPEPSRDPEDLAYDRDADVLWVGDFGDNFETSGAEPRPTVALWRVDLAGDRVPVIHRLAYPDGPHDAEALLIDSDGTPLIITKSLGPAGIYRPAGELVPNNPHEQAVPLERVGEFNPPDTGSDNPFGAAGRQTITGGAVSPDGTRVVLRTYADAFEFDIVDGDVVAAIVDGAPRVTPLPGEPQGEAITYSPDGSHFLTVSETVQANVDPVILRYVPTEPAPEPVADDADAAGAATPNRSLLDRLGWQGVLNLIAAIGLVGLLMVAAGVFGIVRSRRRPQDLQRDPHGAPFDAHGGGDGAHPGTGMVAARARVGTPPQGAHVSMGAASPAAGVYTAGYGAHSQPEPPPDPHWEAPRSGTAYRSGSVYGAGVGYQEHPFDQDHPGSFGQPGGGSGERRYAAGDAAGPRHHDSGAYHGGTYRGGGYDSGDYQGGDYQGGDYQGGDYQGGDYQGGDYHQGGDYQGGYQGGAYQGGTYHSGQYHVAQEDVPDYYYDDPDYSYEFRDRGR